MIILPFQETVKDHSINLPTKQQTDMWVYREVALSSLLESPSTLGREEELLDQPRLLRDHLQRGQADTLIQGRLVLRSVFRKI